MTKDERDAIKKRHGENARAFNERAERDRAARRAALARGQSPAQPKQPEIRPVALTDAEKEIKRLQAHQGGAPHVTILSAEEHEARIHHILKVASQSKGESMSNQTKPEPDPQTVANLANDYIADEKARGRKVNLSQAVAHIRKTKFNLDTDFIASDPELTRRASAQD